MDAKVCLGCPENGPQPIENFSKQTNCDTYFNKCRKCRNKDHKAWKATQAGRDSDAKYRQGHLDDAAKRKSRRVAELVEWVNEMKSKPCMDCGESFPPVCMDYDHVRGDKRRSITRMIHELYSRASILEEIAKCDLVCSNCHRIRTWMTGREMPWYDKIRKHART